MFTLMNRLELENFLGNAYPYDEELSLFESKLPENIYAPYIDGYRCTGILDIFDDVGSMVEEMFIYSPIISGSRKYLI